MSDSELDGALDLEGDLDLPALGDQEDDDDERPIEDGAQLPELVDDGGDPLDDSCADDVPLETEIATDTVEPSAVDDDQSGIEGTADHDDIHLDDEGTSLIDEGRGHAEEGLEFGGDEELGLDPIPSELDDGGLEGLEEPAAQEGEPDELPPLDGADDDDEGDDLDLGLDLGVAPADSDSTDRDGEGEEQEGAQEGTER